MTGIHRNFRQLQAASPSGRPAVGRDRDGHVGVVIQTLHLGATMFKSTIPLTSLMLGVLSLAGCGTSSSSSSGSGGSSASTAQEHTDQENSTAQNGTSQSQDAATQALVLNASSGDPATTSRLSADAVAVPGGLEHLNLTRAVNASWVVNIGTLNAADGTAMFPNLSGSFTITTAGNSVTSWPVGVNTQANGTITVSFDQGNVVYTDPANGATATISGGAYTYSFVANYTETTAHNWTLQIDTSLAVASTAPLSWTVLRSGGVSHAVTLSGYRHVNQNETRAFTAGTTNSLQIVRTVDGEALPGTTSPTGVTGVDTVNPSRSFTNWEYSNNGDMAIWNRYFTATSTYNFLPPVTHAFSNVVEEIYITEGGVVTGPFTSAGLGLRFLLTSTD
jgi:hypothetical protein